MGIFDNFRNAPQQPSGPKDKPEVKAMSFKIMYGVEEVTVTLEPGGNSVESLDAALRLYAQALSVDPSRPVSWRQGAEKIPGGTRPQPGQTYMASATHEQKGGILEDWDDKPAEEKEGGHEMTFTLQYGVERHKIRVKGQSLKSTLDTYASLFGCDMSRQISFRQGPNKVSPDTIPQAGDCFVASVTHEQKG